MFLLFVLFVIINVFIASASNEFVPCIFGYHGFQTSYNGCKWTPLSFNAATETMNGVYLIAQRSNGDGLKLQSSIQSSASCQNEANSQLPKCNPNLKPGYELHMYGAYVNGTLKALSGYATRKGTNETTNFSFSHSAFWVNKKKYSSKTGKVTVGATHVAWWNFDQLIARFTFEIMINVSSDYRQRDAPFRSDRYNSHENVGYYLWLPTRTQGMQNFVIRTMIGKGEVLREGLCGTLTPLSLKREDDSGYSFPTATDDDRHTCPCRSNLDYTRMMRILDDKKEPNTNNFHMYDETKAHWELWDLHCEVEEMIECFDGTMDDTIIVEDDNNVCPNSEYSSQLAGSIALMWDTVAGHKTNCAVSRARDMIQKVEGFHENYGDDNEDLFSPLKIQHYVIRLQSRLIKSSLAAMCLNVEVTIDTAEIIWFEYCQNGIFQNELQFESNLNRDNQSIIQAEIADAFEEAVSTCALLGTIIEHNRPSTTMAPTTTTTTTTIAPTTIAPTTTTTTTKGPGGRVRRRLLSESSGPSLQSNYKVNFDSIQALAMVRRKCVANTPTSTLWVTSIEIEHAIQQCIVYYNSKSSSSSLIFGQDLAEIATEREESSYQKKKAQSISIWLCIASIVGLVCIIGCASLLFLGRTIYLMRRQHEMQIVLVRNQNVGTNVGDSNEI